MTIDTATFAWVLLAIVRGRGRNPDAAVRLHFRQRRRRAPARSSTSFGGGVVWQVLSFAVVVAVSLALLRPRMLGWLGRTPGVPSRTDTLIGKQGQVTQAINPTLGTGRVIVAGEDWAARSTSVVAAGVDVRVVGADGIVLEVLPL